MKKYYVVIVVMLVMTLLVGCGCEHDYVSEITKEANCSEEGERTYTCSKCGDTYTEKIEKNTNHTYESTITTEATYTHEGTLTYTCTLCGDSYTEPIAQLKGNWTKENYVDSFGDKTNNTYIMGRFTGSYSNSATSAGDMTVDVQIDEMVYMYCYMHGSTLPYHISTDSFTLMTKNQNGTTNTYKCYYLDGYGCMFTYEKGFLNEIINNKETSIVIDVYGKSSYGAKASYRFKVNNAGLKEIM